MSERLLVSTALDARDEIEDYWLKHRDSVLQQVKLPNPDLIDSDTSRLLIQDRACQQNNPDELLVGACCVFILSKDERVSQLWLNALCNASRDSLQTTIGRVVDLISRKYPKFTDHAQVKIVRLLANLAEKGFGAHAIVNILLRQIIGGSLSNENLRLTETLLDVLIGNRNWLERNTECFQFATFRYLRLIQDHYGNPACERLLQKEINFVIHNLRNKFSDILPIGKDLVRLLMAVCGIDVFREFWTALLNNPQSLQPKFTGLQELLKIRTPTKFVKLNVTVELHNKISFMLAKVKFGQHLHYEKWLVNKYLSSMSSQTLIPDIMRFIVACIIPTNEILASDILPRWAFCGFMLSQCSNLQATSSARLSLIWDWLLFNENRNTIMDIEPGLLLMQQSRKTHPQTTYGILDFLLRLVKEFYPPMEDEIKRGIINSFRCCIKVGVAKSIEPILIETQRYAPITPCLHNMIQQNLQEFIRPEHRVKIDAPGKKAPRKADPVDGRFSDEDEDSNDASEARRTKAESLPLTKTGEAEQNEKRIENSKASEVSRVDFQNRYYQILEQINALKRDTMNFAVELDERIEKIKLIDMDMAEAMENLIKFKSEEDEFAHHLDIVLSKVSAFDNGPFDSDICDPVATCIYSLCYGSYDPIRIPSEKADDDEFDELLGRPLYILFRQILERIDRGEELENLMDLLVSLQNNDGRTVHHFLFYIYGHNLQHKSDGWSLFPTFCKRITETEQIEALEIQLPLSIASLLEHERELLFRLLPKMYKEHAKLLINHHEVTRIILSEITPKDLQFIQSRLMVGELTMFKTNTPANQNDFKNLLIDSLNWESFEQQALWVLVFAHKNVKPESWGVVIPYLSEEIHFEAVTAISNYFYGRDEYKPSQELYRLFLCAKESKWIAGLMMLFCDSEEKRKNVYDQIGTTLMLSLKKTPSSTQAGGRRKRQFDGGSKKEEPSFVGILKHLNLFRMTVENRANTGDKRMRKAANDPKTILGDDTFLSVLMAAKDNASAIPDDESEDFSDLWKIIEEMEVIYDDSPKQRKEAGKKQSKKHKRTPIEISDDSESDSETPPKKKRT